MIVTNEQLQKGELDEIILKQIKTISNEYVYRFAHGYGNNRDKHPFELRFGFKDVNMYK